MNNERMNNKVWTYWKKNNIRQIGPKWANKWHNSLTLISITGNCVQVMWQQREMKRFFMTDTDAWRETERTIRSWSSSCGRRTVDHFVLVSGLLLGPMTRYYLSHFFVWQLLCCCFWAPSLTRGRVYNLQCNHWLVRSLRTNNHILPSHLRLGSLSVASYDSQGLRWRYSNPPPHGDAPYASLQSIYITCKTPGALSKSCDCEASNCNTCPVPITISCLVMYALIPWDSTVTARHACKAENSFLKQRLRALPLSKYSF
jgi:hypothetical protein